MDQDVQHDKPAAKMNENVPTVLVVEDDIGLNLLIRKTLERDGYKTQSALNGAAAIAAATAHDSIILLDYCLPDMTGKQVIKALIEKEIHAPIIVMTGNGDERIAVEIMKLGARDYLIKEPDFISKLARNIHRVIEVIAKEKELKSAELSLRTSEAKYRNLYENMLDAYVMVDMQGRVIEFNKSYCDMLGYPADEIRNLTYVDLTPEKWHDAEKAIVDNQILRRGYSDIYEKEYRRKDGTVFPVELRTLLFRDSVGGPAGMWAIIRDITERKRTEETLHESEQRYRELFDNISNGVAIYEVKDNGADFIFKDFNKAGERLDGNRKENIVGKSIFEVRPGIKEFGILDVFKRVWKTGVPERHPTTQYRDGRLTGWYENFVYRLPTGEIVAVFDDVTERKHAEEQLLESKALFEAVVENVPLMIFLKEATDLRFVIFNRAGEELLGYDRKALLGKNNLDLFPPEQAAHFMAKDREVLDGEMGMLDIPEEPIMTAKNGQRLLHTRKVCIRGEDGTTKYLLGISEDITERKRAEEKREKLEEQLRQSQKLESIGQLSSGVAHDFNNLLGGIMGHAELLKMGLEKNSPLMRHPEDIVSCCTKAADLTRQLLSFARKSPVEFQRVEMNSFLRQVKKLLDRTIDRRIEIITGIPDQPAYISGDRNLLENAFLNIAVNARDAMPEGGRLHISSEIVALKKNEIGCVCADCEEGTYVKVSFMDNGTGMSKEVKDHIFEPFYTTKEIGKGTGLGLASVYGCVRQHNGHITVESEPGKGTTFRICLRLIETAAPAVNTEDEQKLAPGSGRLLVIDDETVYHDVLSEIFEGLGYTVHCCASGAEAIAFYREHAAAVDVVILDMNMPKMNGLQCFRGLKEINPAVKVIVSSGYGETSDRQIMQKEGLHAFVQKPYLAADMAKKIKEVMAS